MPSSFLQRPQRKGCPIAAEPLHRPSTFVLIFANPFPPPKVLHTDIIFQEYFHYCEISSYQQIKTTMIKDLQWNVLESSSFQVVQTTLPHKYTIGFKNIDHIKISDKNLNNALPYAT